MLADMTGSQYLEWSAYDERYPIGDLRIELEFARLKQSIFAALVGDEGMVVDFMWSFWQDKDFRDVLKKRQIADKVKNVLGISDGN